MTGQEENSSDQMDFFLEPRREDRGRYFGGLGPTLSKVKQKKKKTIQ